VKTPGRPGAGPGSWCAGSPASVEVAGELREPVAHDLAVIALPELGEALCIEGDDAVERQLFHGEELHAIASRLNATPKHGRRAPRSELAGRVRRLAAVDPRYPVTATIVEPIEVEPSL